MGFFYQVGVAGITVLYLEKFYITPGQELTPLDSHCSSFKYPCFSSQVFLKSVQFLLFLGNISVPRDGSTKSPFPGCAHLAEGATDPVPGTSQWSHPRDGSRRRKYPTPPSAEPELTFFITLTTCISSTHSLPAFLFH